VPPVIIDPQLARRLRDSFTAVLAAGDAFPIRFYERLFAADPALRRLFPEEMFEQRGKLLDMMKWTVANLPNHAQLGASLRELGERHEGYGARPADYAVVADAMVAAMGDVAGRWWSPQADADWRTALSRVTAVMQGNA
jgi:hemoglobin-like flavoprotein